MRTIRHSLTHLIAIMMVVLLSACATVPGPPAGDQPVAYTVRGSATVLERYAPVFLIENNRAAHNRIGTPQASITVDGKE